MAQDEVGPLGGFAALVGVFSIMVILIAVLALVVVNALKHSPWGTFTVGADDPDRDADGLVHARGAARTT